MTFKLPFILIMLQWSTQSPVVIVTKHSNTK